MSSRNIKRGGLYNLHIAFIDFWTERWNKFSQGRADSVLYEVSFIIVTKQGRKSSFKKQKVLLVLYLLIGSSDILLINFHDV